MGLGVSTLLLGVLVLFHHDVSSQQCLLFLFFLPLFLEALRIFSVNWHFDICILLDEYNAVVEVSLAQSNTEGTIFVDILPLQVSTSTEDVQRTDGGTPLGCIVQGRLQPLVRNINLQCLLGTKA